MKAKRVLLLLSLSLPFLIFSGILLHASARNDQSAALTSLGNGTAISITQEIMPNPSQSGVPSTYSLQVSNESSLDLPAIITDDLPSQVMPNGNLSWTPIISAGETWAQQVVITPLANYDGPIVNEVQVSIPTTWAENDSYCTTCAEEDNINIPLYGDDISHFRLTASHPAYDFSTDNCAADFSGCPLASPSATGEVTCTTLLDDGINVIIVCNDTEWWLPDTMTVTVNNQSLAGHRLVWHKRIADEASWPEILVYYQDGNLRLKPHPPLGQTDVCFGSSVIVGPVTPDPIRPFSPIESIVVNPAEMSLDVTYQNAGSARLELTVDRTQAQVDVVANYDTSNAFAIFRSMYVAEDNADAARVETAVGDFALLDISETDWTTAWPTLAGPQWFFYRQSVSNHNTSAPDILVETFNGYATYSAKDISCVNQCSLYLPLIQQEK